MYVYSTSIIRKLNTILELQVQVQKNVVNTWRKNRFLFRESMVNEKDNSSAIIAQINEMSAAGARNIF